MFRTLMTSRRFVLDAIPLLGSGKINYVALAKALRESGDAG
jgi:hypothetical protein